LLGEKKSRDFHPRQPAKRINVARFTQTNRARKARLVSNGFWHIVSVVKEQDLPVMQKGYIQLEEYLRGTPDCQQPITDFHTDSQRVAKSIRGGRIPTSRKKLSQKNSMKNKARAAKKRSSERSTDLARSVFKTLERLGVLLDGLKLGVAVSGGADSVALLRLLLELRDSTKTEHPFEIAVLHFNHQLRGRASDADEKFVRNVAHEFQLAFWGGTADVSDAAKRAKRNLEDAGRRERYAFFKSAIANGHVACVATAHTMDDQAETVLAHILRGTGLAGLGGIHAISGGVVRPLLGVRRAALRRYLKLGKQRWREDATNRDVSRTRARIRTKLIPLLEKQFQEQVVEHLAQLAEHAREDEAFIDAAATKRLSGIFRGDGATRVRVEDLTGPEAPAALRGRMIRQIVNRCKVRAGQLSSAHVASVLEFALRGENGKRLQLPGGVAVRRDRDMLQFRSTTAAVEEENSAIIYEHSIPLAGPSTTVALPLLNCAFRFRTIDWLGERGETSNKRWAMDCARLTQLTSAQLLLRNWRAGDRLQPAGRSRVYKLKRLLNAQGISLWERNGWPVLASNGEVLWSRGFGVAAQFAATKDTRTALVIDEEPL
jgi:tRNA(Ile)-lysidine synthase